MNEKIEIDGNYREWEHKCWQNAENKNPFALINFDLEMRPICQVIARKYGYKLKFPISNMDVNVCYFSPINFGMTKITTPDVFSGSPENYLL